MPAIRSARLPRQQQRGPRRRVILRRIILLLLFSILLSATLTTIFYHFSSYYIFTQLNARSYTSKASYIASRTAAWLGGELSDERYKSLMSAAPELLNSRVAISLANQEVTVYAPPSLAKDEISNTDLLNFLLTYDVRSNGGEKQIFQIRVGQSADNYLVVSYPIRPSSSSPASQTLGRVFLIKSYAEVRASRDSLNLAILLASFFAFTLMLFPAILAVSRILRPLGKLIELARELARGNFGLRSNIRQAGEIGDLAFAIDSLAEALDTNTKALLSERNRLRQVLDGISEGILAVNQQLHVTHANPSIMQLFFPAAEGGRQGEGSLRNLATGYETGDDPLWRLENYLHSDQSLYADFRHVLEHNVELTRNFEQAGRIINMRISPLLGNWDQQIGAVSLFRDVTAEEKLEQTRRDYVANVSHELRTPLTSLRALIEPLSDGLVQDREDRMRYYRIILGETLRLSRLIDDMLELSRLQAGQLKIEKQAFSLVEIFDALELKYGAVAEERGIRLAFPHYRQIPQVYSNADRIEQILVILMDNAMKFTPRGGEIQLWVLDSDSRLEVSVKDSGPGVAPEDAPHVFERFYKAEKSRGKSGTGLGLSIAREIIQAMGEEIWLESKPGQGAKFSFTVQKAGPLLAAERARKGGEDHA